MSSQQEGAGLTDKDHWIDSLERHHFPLKVFCIRRHCICTFACVGFLCILLLLLKFKCLSSNREALRSDLKVRLIFLH